MADEAAMSADDAASMAEEAAIDDDDIASEAGAIEGVDIVAGGVLVVVVVVDVSSFFEQAAKEMAAARVTINSAVFIYLLGGFMVRKMTGKPGNPSIEEPQHTKTWKA